MQRLAYHLTVQSDGLVRAKYTRTDSLLAWRESLLDRSQLPHLQSHLVDIAKSAVQSRSKLATVGRYLYQLLFTGPVQAHFSEVVWPLVDTVSSPYHLAVTLAFQATDSQQVSQAAVLPWEFLYYPHGSGTFLATDPRVFFSRRDPTRPPGAAVLAERANLRVLLVHLQPQDAAPVSLVRIRNILKELGEEETAVRRLFPVILQNPTPAQLAGHLQEIRPHVLHLLLHGRFAPDSTRFGFTDSQDQTRWYGDRSLANLFPQHRPRLVVVQACEGGRPVDAGRLAHGAARLLTAGVPAVVAMQYPITNAVGWEFAETLYRQLTAGQVVDTAVQAGRRHLAQYDDRLPDDHASRDFGGVILWQQAVLLPTIQEKKIMTQTVTLITPEGERYETEVAPDTVIGELVRAFVGQLSPALATSTQYSLHLHDPDHPALDPSETLAEASVPDNAELWLKAQRLSPDEPIGLTIEDEEGNRFATAVLLNTPLQEIVDAFLANQPDYEKNKPAVTVMAGAPETIAEYPLPLQMTLHEAGISHDALLRIKTAPVETKE